MKSRSAKLLFFILSITGVLLQDFSAPASGLSAEFRIGAVTTNVNLRKTPSLQGDIVAGLQQSSPVKIYGEKDDWYRVSSKKNYILLLRILVKTIKIILRDYRIQQFLRYLPLL